MKTCTDCGCACSGKRCRDCYRQSFVKQDDPLDGDAIDAHLMSTTLRWLDEHDAGGSEKGRDLVRLARQLQRDSDAKAPAGDETDPLVVLRERLDDIARDTYPDITQLPNWGWGAGWIQPATATPVTGSGVVYARALATIVGTFGLEHLWGWQLHALALIHSALKVISIIVCRQNGKTTLLYLIVLDELTRGHCVAFTLHQRSLAREKWEEVQIALTSTYPGRFRTSKRQGNEQVVDLLTGGKFKLTTPDDAGGRSDTFDTIIIDESAHIGTDYLAAAAPSTLTKPDAKRIMISSGMTDQSIDLATARETAYEQLSLPPELRTHGVLEYAAKTDPGHAGIDVHDQSIWERSIPTLGLPGGATVANVRAAAIDMSPDKFCREYLSVPTGSPLTPPITSIMWAGVQTEGPLDSKAMLNTVLAIDTNPIQSQSSIVVAALIGGEMRCAVLSAAAGDDWLFEDVIAAARKTRPMAIVVDAMSPAAQLVERIERAGWPVTVTGPQAMARSCAAFFTHVQAGTIGVVSDDTLTLAATSAIRRQIADSGWAWHRRDGTGLDITPIVAASLAVHQVHGYAT